MSINAGSGAEIEQLEDDAESLAEENLNEMMEVDRLLGDLESKLEEADQLIVKEIKQEKKGDSGVRRNKKEVELDVNLENELEDAINRILKAKDEIEDVINPLKNSQKFALVAGFGSEIGKSGSPGEELMDEIDSALRDEFGESYSRETMVEVGEMAENLDGEMIDSREKLKEAAEELEEIVEKEREEIQAEDNDTLEKEEREVYSIVEEVLEKIKEISNFKASRRDLENGSARSTGPMDRFIGRLSLTAKLSEYEVQRG
jgi:hypothetical protein